MARIRFGLVGAGMMGREHIRNLKLVDAVELAAIADPHAPSVALAVEEAGPGADVAVFHRGADLVREARVDAVILASPNHTHRAELEALLKSGAHILCEKPLATTLEDARWAADAADARREVFWTAMEYRFMPPARRFIEEVHAGAVGRLVMLSLREHRFPFLRKVGDWNRFSRNTGGTMVEKCCHFFDLMRLVAGSEPQRIYCSGGMDVNHLDEVYGGERPDILDNAFTLVDFRSGVRALLDLSMFADGAEEQETLTAVGATARLEAFIPSGVLVHSPRPPPGGVRSVRREHAPVDPEALAAGTHHGAVYYQLLAFLDAIEGRAPVQVTAEDGLRAVAMGVAAERSAREHRPVDLAELGL